jgi:hypothetical protein
MAVGNLPNSTRRERPTAEIYHASPREAQGQFQGHVGLAIRRIGPPTPFGKFPLRWNPGSVLSLRRGKLRIGMITYPDALAAPSKAVCAAGRKPMGIATFHGL